MVNAVLLEPLPIADSDQLMAVGQSQSQNRARLSQFSFRKFADFREQSRSFEPLAAYNFVLTGNREAVRLRATVMTADLFPLLRVSPAIGRTFLPEEDAAGGGLGGRPAILSGECSQD